MADNKPSLADKAKTPESNSSSVEKTAPASAPETGKPTGGPAPSLEALTGGATTGTDGNPQTSTQISEESKGGLPPEGLPDAKFVESEAGEGSTIKLPVAVPDVNPETTMEAANQQVERKTLKFLTGYKAYNSGEVAGFTVETGQKLVDHGIARWTRPGEESDRVTPVARQVKMNTGVPTRTSADSEPYTTKPLEPGLSIGALLNTNE